MRLLLLVLNVERRPDRRAWIEQSIAVPDGDELVVVQAVDGRGAQGGGDGEVCAKKKVFFYPSSNTHSSITQANLGR
jgi:hypothetical protein